MAFVPRLFKTIFDKSIICKRGFRMSAQLRADKVLEEMKNKNPYYDKYASKISSLKETSPEEFLNRIESVEKKVPKKKEKEKPRDYSELLHPKPEVKSNSQHSQVKLSDIMKVELLESKSVDEIKHIWLEYHKQKDVLVATMTTEIFETQMNRGKKYPMFIVPLPRSEGFEFFLLQFAANAIHFTTLLCYQVHKENAPECLNVVHFTELKEKGIVLMRSEYDKNVLTVQEAQCLVNQLQLYYTQNITSKLDLLEKFTNQPKEFKHADVIHELKNLTL